MDASANMCKPSEQMVGDPFVPAWKPKASSKTIRISPSVLTELRIAPLVTRTSPEWQQIAELAGVLIGADGRAVLEPKKNDQMAIGV